ncbi:MAG: RimK/LysX family protein [Hyphomicrobium sp.]|jgi:ribosomal protein S6--L-glutamate ligase
MFPPVVEFIGLGDAVLPNAPHLIVGWQEWVALPELGLPALKAKIDTGAKTSALHTELIEPYGSSRRPKVRFSVRPRPDAHLEVIATADIVDRREVTSSNGVRELRYVIETRLCIGGREWPIEVTLTNREHMTYRMLIGRQAMRSDMLVDCAASFCQPRLSYRLYAGQ